MATIDMGLKEGDAVRLSRSAGNPSNTIWPAPMSTSVPNISATDVRDDYISNL